VIEIPARQGRVGGEEVDDLHQLGVQILAVPTGFLSLVVTLKRVVYLISRIQTLQQFVRLANLD